MKNKGCEISTSQPGGTTNFRNQNQKKNCVSDAIENILLIQIITKAKNNFFHNQFDLEAHWKNWKPENSESWNWVLTQRQNPYYAKLKICPLLCMRMWRMSLINLSLWILLCSIQNGILSYYPLFVCVMIKWQ